MTTVIRLESASVCPPVHACTSFVTPDGPRLSAMFDPSMSVAHERVACTCTDCRRLRAQPFVCDRCGCADTPLVLPCTCVDADRRRIAALRLAVHQARELGRDRVFAYTPRQAKVALRRAIDTARQHDCSASDSPCGHGRVACPVCLSNDDAPACSWAAPKPMSESFTS